MVNFFTVTDAPVFAVHDSHIRFIGGVWLGLGLVMLAGTLAFRRLRTVLVRPHRDDLRGRPGTAQRWRSCPAPQR